MSDTQHTVEVIHTPTEQSRGDENQEDDYEDNGHEDNNHEDDDHEVTGGAKTKDEGGAGATAYFVRIVSTPYDIDELTKISGCGSMPLHSTIA